VLGALLGHRAGRRELALVALGLTGGLWAVGDLLFLGAETTSELILARRLFYLGAAGLAPVWLWLSLRTARPDWFVARPGSILLPFVIPLAAYSCLYWDESVRFIDWQSPSPSHRYGPLFDLYIAHQHALIAIGTVYFLRTSFRLRRTSPVVMSALLVAAALPLFTNIAYLFGGLESDWTAAALAPAGVLFWVAMVESGLVAHLPIDRHRLIEQLDVGVVVADAESRVLSANPAARRLVELEGMIGRRLTDVVAAAEQRTDASIESRALALRGPIGIVGHALILTDRTEAETSRRRLELAGRLEALGSLTAGIAHEVNNPLAYVQANLSSLGSTAKDLSDPALRACLPDSLQESVADMESLVEETHEGLERIRLLVQRLKTFSRTPDLSAHAVEIDLSALVRQSAAVALVGRRGEPLQIEGEEDLHVLTLESAVFQILVNLLLNAAQAAPEDPRIRVRLCRQDPGVRLDVIDNGPGIAPSVLPRIFDPFFTTKPTGTGLGLSLSYDLAKQVGGRLQAGNCEGGGALFSLWLPRYPPGADADEGSRSLETLG